MSAAVCGSKRRSFFDDMNTSATSPPVSKRLRCSSSSPVLERTLEDCGNDLDSAFKGLIQHISESQEENLHPGKGSDANSEEGLLSADGGVTTSENVSSASNLPLHGVQWVEMLVREMMIAPSIDDAKARATWVLESLEKSLSAHAAMAAAQSFHKENTSLKVQIEALMRDNTILKRAVSIQHERQKEYDDKNHELQFLKQSLSQYQEQLRKLEVHNYALQMHLKQAQQRNSIPGHFNPHIF